MISARHAVSATARCASSPDRPLTAAYVMIAMVEDGPTATSRVDVTRANTTIAATAVYSPATGYRPATCPYPRPCGTSVTATANPATRSPHTPRHE
ncbi:hypothetical protein OH775_09445 [Streptomyces sp. NBC_01615]